MSAQLLTEPRAVGATKSSETSSRQIKVLHVVPSFYPAVCYGGPIFSVLALNKELANLGCEVRVITTNATGSGACLTEGQKSDPETAPLLIDYCHRVGRGMVSPALLWRLGRLVRWCDVVHLTGVYNFTTFPALIACRLYKKPIVWSCRGALQGWAG